VRVPDRLIIYVTTERTLSGETFSLAGTGDDQIYHGVHALGVIRESGFLIINHDEAITLTIGRKTGWSRTRADAVPATHRVANAIYYRFYNPGTALTVTVHPVKPRISAKQDAQLVLTTEEIRLRTNFDFKVEQAGVFELSLLLPMGLTIDSVQAAGMKGYRVVTSDGVRSLKVAFTHKVLGERRVTIVAHSKPIPPGQPKPQRIPLPSAIGAVIESGRLQLFAPASLAVIVEDAVASGMTPGKLTPVRTPFALDARRVSAWSYHRQPISLNVRIDRIPTRLSARVGTTVQIREDGMRVSTRLEYTIEHSPLGTFRILVAKPILDSLRIQNAKGESVPFKSEKVMPAGQPEKKKKPQKKEKKEKPAAADNWRIVTFAVPKPLLGRATFLLTYEIAADADGEKPDGESTRHILAQPIRVADLPAGGDSSFIPVSQLFGEVAVLSDPSFKVTAEKKAGDDVESIDSREVRFVSRGNGLYFRYHKEPVSVSIQATKLKIQPVVQTVIAKALVETVIGRDKTATFRCRYRIVTSERQRLRVDLPKPAETLKVLVNGKPVSLELNTNAKNVKEDFRSFLVSVSRTETSDRPLSLTLQFRLPVTPAPFEGALGSLRLYFPKIGAGDSSTTVVQQLRTVIWVPREYVLVGNVEGFARRTWTRLQGILPDQFSADSDNGPLEEWIGVGTGGGFEFPHDGHAYRFDNLGGSEQIEVSFANLSFATWVASIALLLIAWVLAKTSWENKLSVLLLLVFLAALLSLNDMDWVYHGLIVTRYGLAAMLAWWMIRSAFGLRRRAAVRDAGRASTGGPPIAMYASIVSAVIPPPGVFTNFIAAARKPEPPPGGGKASRTDA
ncbi:MAG: hypothetical protein IID45_08340, partial [Planctomycetes bacterium]|nr:hypothetical protein [Planctomycetota bacterium]